MDGRDTAAIDEGHAGGEQGRKPHSWNPQTVEQGKVWAVQQRGWGTKQEQQRADGREAGPGQKGP